MPAGERTKVLVQRRDGRRERLDADEEIGRQRRVALTHLTRREWRNRDARFLDVRDRRWRRRRRLCQQKHEELGKSIVWIWMKATLLLWHIPYVALIDRSFLLLFFQNPVAMRSLR